MEASENIDVREQAFHLEAYNATGEGRWVDLLNHKVNAAHTGISYTNNPHGEFFNTSLRLQLYSAHELRKVLLRINGKLVPAAFFMSPYQFQDNILDIGFVSWLQELKVYLPPRTFMAVLTGHPQQPWAVKGKVMDIPDMYAVRLKNNTDRKYPADLTGHSGSDELVDIDVLTGTLQDIAKASHILLMSSDKTPRKRMLFKDTGVVVGETELLVPVDIDQFQVHLVKVDISGDKHVDKIRAAWNVMIELQPYEELLVVFHS